MTILVLTGTVFVIISEMFHGKISLNSLLLLLLVNFVSGLGIDVYIPHHKYQVKPHSSTWFSKLCVCHSSHRNHFFHLYQQNKSSESKVKFLQASNHCKRVLEAVKFAYANKAKESSLHRNLALRTSGELLVVFSAKVNLLYLFY